MDSSDLDLYLFSYMVPLTHMSQLPPMASRSVQPFFAQLIHVPDTQTMQRVTSVAVVRILSMRVGDAA